MSLKNLEAQKCKANAGIIFCNLLQEISKIHTQASDLLYGLCFNLCGLLWGVRLLRLQDRRLSLTYAILSHTGYDASKSMR